LQEALRSEILQSLRIMKLVAENEAPSLIELTGGVSGEIILAATSAGAICVKKVRPFLKVAGEWRASPARAEAEKKWIRLVGELLPRNVPEIIAEDAPAFTFAMKYLDPEHHRNWKSLLRDGEISGETGAEVGKILGTVHRRTAGDLAVSAAFANDEDFADLRLDPYFAAAAAADPEVGPALHALIERTASTKRALVHGDFSPKNILIGPQGPVILDAECAWYGEPAFDPAFCLNHLLLKCVWKPQHSARYLRCALAFWDSYLGSAAWADRGQMEERVATLLPGLMLARADGKSPVEDLTDPAVKNKVRAFAKRFLLKPEKTLAPVIAEWRKESGS
jgi:tRNA A-37 threonylcarbamoyl transferase component Bud32